MPRLEKISRLRSSTRLAGHCMRMSLLALALLPPPVFCAAVPLAGTNWVFEATNHLGQWIWDTNTLDKQTCCFWKSFEIPHGAKVANAILRITVDNGYSLFLDGREIGRGSDWRTVTEYNVTRLLNPGRHNIGVEGFNDRLEAGLIFGLNVQLVDQRTVEVVSDGSWLVVAGAERKWGGPEKSFAGMASGRCGRRHSSSSVGNLAVWTDHRAGAAAHRGAFLADGMVSTFGAVAVAVDHRRLCLASDAAFDPGAVATAAAIGACSYRARHPRRPRRATHATGIARRSGAARTAGRITGAHAVQPNLRPGARIVSRDGRSGVGGQRPARHAA